MFIQEGVVELIQEDLVKELAAFGFTLNQAKVYLSIVRAGSISVGKIAESSKLHRQDIYKILPKLEKKGLITKTLGTPIVIKAIPVKISLKSLVSLEKKEALERIACMEANMKEVSNAVSILYETGTGPEYEETHFSLLTKDNELTNRADLLFEKASIECDVVVSLELLMTKATKLHERFRTAANNGARIRLIIEAPSNGERLTEALERVRPDSKNVAAKFVVSKSPKPYQIIDAKEVWISTTKKTPSGLPCVLWSNSKNIVETYQERFEGIWNDRDAITILPEETAKKKEAAKPLAAS